MGEKIELIDTLWNVNNYGGTRDYIDTTELIDTLWNVNFLAPMLYSVIPFELIDTLWNVNYFYTFADTVPSRN